jgi:hypothetical protein
VTLTGFATLAGQPAATSAKKSDLPSDARTGTPVPANDVEVKASFLLPAIERNVLPKSQKLSQLLGAFKDAKDANVVDMTLIGIGDEYEQKYSKDDGTLQLFVKSDESKPQESFAWFKIKDGTLSFSWEVKVPAEADLQLRWAVLRLAAADGRRFFVKLNDSPGSASPRNMKLKRATDAPSRLSYGSCSLDYQKLRFPEPVLHSLRLRQATLFVLRDDESTVRGTLGTPKTGEAGALIQYPVEGLDDPAARSPVLQIRRGSPKGAVELRLVGDSPGKPNSQGAKSSGKKLSGRTRQKGKGDDAGHLRLFESTLHASVVIEFSSGPDTVWYPVSVVK